jgi:hypothetical protein
MKNKKGQSAIEYLEVYGWAILIILIVAGALAYYGFYLPMQQKQTTAYDLVTTLSTNPTLFCKFLDKETLSCDVKYCFQAGGFTSDSYCQDATNKSAIFRLTKT